MLMKSTTGEFIVGEIGKADFLPNAGRLCSWRTKFGEIDS